MNQNVDFFWQEYCVAVARCLNDAADKMSSCNRALVAIVASENVTNCQKDVHDSQLSLAELHEDQARVFANCINGMTTDWNFTCPLANMYRRKVRALVLCIQCF